MFPDRDLDLEAPGPANEEDLTQDLGLERLFQAMAEGDKFLFEVARVTLLQSLADPSVISYRQDVLDDARRQPEVVRELYRIASEAIEGEKRVYGWLIGKYPMGIVHRSIEVMQLFLVHLRQLRQLAQEREGQVSSAGLRELFRMLQDQLPDDYFELIEDHLKRLRFRDGIWISARLSQGNKGADYVLRSPASTKRSLRERIGLGDQGGYSFEIADRDEAGARALSELNDRGVNLVANAMAQSSDHILSFFTLLRAELGFYVGCLNLEAHLAAKGEPVCRPEARPAGECQLRFRGLYDVGLSLAGEERLVGNDADADGRSLVMITGANSGGKSTFLRSVGIAQLMLQCGMFVGAEAFRADVREGIFTHFIREEDPGMSSGRLDEELTRMAVIADSVGPRSLVLFNESFSATNELEGSEIARQIVRALTEAGIKVVFVTHLYDLAQGFYQQDGESRLFLRAQRAEDGHRTFKLVESEPLPTSYGEDLYRRSGGWRSGPGEEALATAPGESRPAAGERPGEDS